MLAASRDCDSNRERWSSAAVAGRHDRTDTWRWGLCLSGWTNRQKHSTRWGRTPARHTRVRRSILNTCNIPQVLWKKKGGGDGKSIFVLLNFIKLPTIRFIQFVFYVYYMWLLTTLDQDVTKGEKKRQLYGFYTPHFRWRGLTLALTYWKTIHSIYVSKETPHILFHYKWSLYMQKIRIISFFFFFYVATTCQMLSTFRRSVPYWHTEISKSKVKSRSSIS